MKTAADRAAAELFQRRHGADGVGVDALPSLDLPGTKEARVWFDKPR